MNELYDQMRIAVLEGEEETAVELAQRVLANGMDPVEAMNQGFLKGIREAGQLYEEGEYYLPELICSADAMKAALEILEEELKKSSNGIKKKGTVVMATVAGDVHDIGKTIVGAMMTAAGYKIHDLGVDVPNQEVVKVVEKLKPDILGLSALLTTTMEEQLNIINQLKAEGLRSSVKIIIGGAPVSRQWSDMIEADGYADNAIAAVKLADALLAKGETTC